MMSSEIMKEDIFVISKSNLHVFAGLFQKPLADWYNEDKVGFGVICDGAPAALVLSTFSDEAVWLDWIYVKEEYREKGVIYRLLNRFFEKIRGIVVENTAYTACMDEKTKHVLLKAGFEFEEEPEYYTISAPLSKLTSVPEHKPDPAIQLLNRLDKNALNKVNKAARECHTQAVELPIVPKDYMHESLVYMEKDEPKAVLLLKEAEGRIDVAYAYLSGENGKPLIKLIAAAKKLLLNSYDEDIEITMTTLTNESEKLASHLFPEADRNPVWTGSLDLSLF